MNIQVTDVLESTTETGRYFYVEMTAGKHAATICINPNDVRVIVQNASHKVWRGAGKYFATVDAAVANYKSDAVKAMIQHAADLARVSSVTTGTKH